MVTRSNRSSLDQLARGVKALVRDDRSFFRLFDDWVYGPKQVAEELGISVRGARRLMADGTLCTHQNRRGARMVTPEELAAYVETHLKRPLKASGGRRRLD